ncbi:MAG: outer membrane lipoprotein-sorting protein [Alphaproteobacteria bacterium]
MKTLIVSAALTALSGAAFAATYEDVKAIADPAEKGRKIADITEAQDAGFGDSEATMKMVLTNKNGQESTRELRMKVLENPDPADGDKTMIVFDKPRDVAGTALLTYAHHTDSDDQWLFLPKPKPRVKRISSKNKAGPFMGSEFAFEDFSSTEANKFSYTWLADEPCPVEEVKDRICAKVERIPLYEDSGYTKQVSWTDTTDFNPRRVDYYDRRGAHLKTLTFTEYRQYQDKFWRSHNLSVENLKTGKSTTLRWEDMTFSNGLSDSDFTKASLKRAK